MFEQTPQGVLVAVRDAVLDALTLGEPDVVIVGFDGVGEMYGSNCSMLRIEWTSMSLQQPLGSVSGGISGCSAGAWVMPCVVSMRRCFPTLDKVAGISDGNPVSPSDSQARASLLTNEALAVSKAIVAIAVDGEALRFDRTVPFGPDGEVAGWDIRFEYRIEEP